MAERLRIIETPLGENSASKRIEKRLRVDFDPEVLTTSREIAEVSEAILGLRIIEYGSQELGNLVFVTNGVHGEETLEENDSVVTLLDKELSKSGITLQSGNVILIPNVNAPGYNNKTRYVFPDEKDTNLNNVFDRYKTGEGSEFWKLSSKTEMYAWLLMKYFTGKRDEHQKKFGSELKTFLIDDHAEEIAVPHIRVDRMYEDQAVLEQLLTAINDIQIPAALEYADWANLRFVESLSATATAQGIISVTIEEGRTLSPEVLSRQYVFSQLMLFAKNLGVIDIPQNILTVYADMFNDRYLPKALKMTKQIWEHQHESSVVFCLDDTPPTIYNHQGKELKPRDFVRAVLDNDRWAGYIKVQYASGLRGKQGGKEIPIGNLFFDETNQVKAYLALDDFPDTSWIISVPEPPNSPKTWQRIINYGFFLVENNGQQTITLDIIDPTGKIQLQPDVLRALFDNPDVRIDLSIFELTCIVPDQQWERRKDGATVTLLKKNTTTGQ